MRPVEVEGSSLAASLSRLVTTGNFMAATKSGSTRSAARTKIRDCPEASRSSNVFNFASSTRAVKASVSGPCTASPGKSTWLVIK